MGSEKERRDSSHTRIALEAAADSFEIGLSKMPTRVEMNVQVANTIGVWIDVSACQKEK